MSTAALAAEPAAETMQYLTFALAGEQYAVGVLQVREILRYETVTSVPTAPAAVHGVLNLRGSVVPVIDLAVRFGLAPTPVTRRTCIVIVETGRDGDRAPMGILVDSVSQVLELGPDDIAPPPAFGAGERVEHLRGMARQGARFALVLDLERVLSHASLLASPAALAEAAAAAEAQADSADSEDADDGGADAEPAPAAAEAT